MADLPLNIQKLLDTETLEQISYRMANSAVHTIKTAKKMRMNEKDIANSLADAVLPMLIYLKHKWWKCPEPSQN